MIITSKTRINIKFILFFAILYMQLNRDDLFRCLNDSAIAAKSIATRSTNSSAGDDLFPTDSIDIFSFDYVWLLTNNLILDACESTYLMSVYFQTHSSSECNSQI